MLIDSRELTDGHIFSCDVCIIGAGAAGITIAKSYLSSNLSVCLMESGGLKSDAKTQSLYKGWTEFNGGEKSENYLHGSRLRFFGGTTNHWAGWCRPLDPIDFRKRDWIYHSGWPIDEATLKPYYSRAGDLVEIEKFKDFSDNGRDCWGDSAIVNSENLCSKYIHFSPPTRFGVKYRSELIEARNIKVFVNANAQTISLNESGNKVDHVNFETLTGGKFTVAAKVTIVATGGIENARLLLLSNDIHKNGIGNSYDQLGRYFMEHPHYPYAASIFFSKSPDNLDKYYKSKNTKFFAALGFTDQMQKENQLLNTAMQIYTADNTPGEILNAGDVVRFFDSERKGISNMKAPTVYAQVSMLSELNPDPDNRISLDNEVDRFGLRKAKLRLNLTDQHIKTITKSIELLSIEFGKISNGRLRVGFREDDPTRNYYPANHHMGTTRMSATAKTGVVDADCKVHGVSNLYVAGSSVFPTAGFANPTFTIVALAERLSDNIRQTLKRG